MIGSGLTCEALLAVAACNQPRIGDSVGSADTLRLLAGPIPTGPAPSKVAVGDLTGDGHADFEPLRGSPLRIELGPHSHAVLLADMDRDGNLDLLVDARHGEAIVILSGDGRGRFAGLPERVDVGGDPYRGMVLGDMNGDGAPDLLIAEEPGRIRVLGGLQDGRFGDEPLFEIGFAPGAKAVGVGDIDGDGFADAGITSWNSNDALVLFGGRDGIRSEVVAAGENPWGVSVADLTGDGRAEIFVLDNTGHALRVYSSRSDDQEF